MASSASGTTVPGNALPGAAPAGVTASGLAGTSPAAPPNPALPPPSAMSANPAPSVPVGPPAGTATAMSSTPPAAPAPAKSDAAATPPKTDNEHVFGMTEGHSRVVVTAKADAWVAVKDANDKNVFSRLMHAGDIYRAPDRPGLMLHTGNGAGIVIAVDGHDIPLTGNGKVRNIALDPSRLQANAGAGTAQ